ncbi:MAG: lysophospholipase [Magnetovibrio sp.]|nr:lysophospholipase [Magnetovibrio sp.]|tara:strand:- start:86 stop:526 length:441 start_codon:yes stop_codon:yes gene_type:complete
MNLHLLKLCVGINTVEDLAIRQKKRLESSSKKKGEKHLQHITRYKPKRADEILGGGSIYWVICRKIQARQLILNIKNVQRDDGGAACALFLSPELIEVEPRKHRPFQGWRYLPEKDAPNDMESCGNRGFINLPQEIARELKELCLI